MVDGDGHEAVRLDEGHWRGSWVVGDWVGMYFEKGRRVSGPGRGELWSRLSGGSHTSRGPRGGNDDNILP